MASASELEKGKYFLHNDEPVRVLRKELVAYGTHSHSKLKITVQGMRSKGEKIVTMQHHDRVEVLDIIRKLGNVISKTDDKVQVMDSVSYETLDADAENELHSQLVEGDQVIFVDYLGSAQILEKK